MMPDTTPKPKKRKPAPQSQLSHDERFWALYKAAFLGLHAQFERPDEFANARFEDGAAELKRSKDIARRAWNSAIYGCAMFEDDERTIERFNETVEAVAKREEEEEGELDKEMP